MFIAVKTFGVKKAIGYEISPWPYLLSKVRLRYQNSSISKRIKVYKKSLFKADLSDVNVIYVYLFPGLLEKLYPMLQKAEKENKSLRIVSPVFKINNLKSKKVINIYHAGWKKNINIYLY